jgi:hypothetical protein
MTQMRNCPPDVLQWIAWYPDQGLNERQRGAVEAHAAACADCRDEIALVSGTSTPDAHAPDAASVLARLVERIEGSGDVMAPASAPRERRAPARRWALAAGVAVLLAASAGLVVSALRGESEPVFRTAASRTTPLGDAPTLDVVFARDIPAARLTEALRAIHGEIVAGPTPLQRYRVRLPLGSDPSSAARRLRGENGVALFAEPVAP